MLKAIMAETHLSVLFLSTLFHGPSSIDLAASGDRTSSNQLQQSRSEDSLRTSERTHRVNAYLQEVNTSEAFHAGHGTSASRRGDVPKYLAQWSEDFQRLETPAMKK